MMSESSDDEETHSSDVLELRCFCSLAKLLHCVVAHSNATVALFVVWFASVLLEEYAAHWWGLVPSWFLSALDGHSSDPSTSEIPTVTCYALFAVAFACVVSIQAR